MLFDFFVNALPGGKSLGEKLAALVGQDQDAVAPIGGVRRDFNQTAALERFERRGQGGPIHRQQGSDRTHGGRDGAIQRHQKGKLPIRESERAQGLIKAACQGARGPLYVKTKARIPNHNGGFERERIWT
jgi:hypothetical protein